MKRNQVLRLTCAGLLCALAVVGSLISFPVFGSKCAPVQHMVNVIAGVLLGPGYAVGAAFVASFIRNLIGTGTLLAFPGSMCGALLAGLLYRAGGKLPYACVGEVVGTGILGALLAVPIAVGLLGRTATLFAFVPSFLINTIAGSIVAALVVTALDRTSVFRDLRAAMR